jgi:hypothetical protein
MPPARGAGGRFINGGGGGKSSGLGRVIQQARQTIGRTADSAMKGARSAFGGGGSGGGKKFVRRTGDWKQVRSLMTGINAKMSIAIQKALLAEGQLIRGHMVQGFTSQAPGGLRFAPLSPVTLTLRGGAGFSGSKALIRTGTLRGSITVVQEQGGVVFVGVHRRSASRVNIARIHEFGATIRVTNKMRLFLMARMKEAAQKGFAVGGSSKHTGFIVIPPRPFVRPIFEQYVRAGKHHAQQRMQAHVARSLGFYKGPIR